MINPFLKWAGGKRWLISQPDFPTPPSYTRYVEPFLGSGAVFFHLQPDKALLSDANAGLIHLYEVIRDQPSALLFEMKRHHSRHSKEYYYEVRARKHRSKLKKSAQFLYLNRTCWNGLYRVNSKGEFNVPKGTKDTVLFDTDDFVAVSDLLSNADIRCSDFEAVIDETGEGDFVFVDPPYTVQHNYNNFLKYNEKIFSWDDQIRLRDAVGRAIQRGVMIAVTNADHQAVRELYSKVGSYFQLHRQSVLAGKATKRGATTEALFLGNWSCPRLIGHPVSGPEL